MFVLVTVLESFSGRDLCLWAFLFDTKEKLGYIYIIEYIKAEQELFARNVNAHKIERVFVVLS